MKSMAHEEQISEGHSCELHAGMGFLADPRFHVTGKMGGGADLAVGSGNSSALCAVLESKRNGQPASCGRALCARAHRENGHSDSLRVRSQLSDPGRGT